MKESRRATRPSTTSHGSPEAIRPGLAWLIQWKPADFPGGLNGLPASLVQVRFTVMARENLSLAAAYAKTIRPRGAVVQPRLIGPVV